MKRLIDILKFTGASMLFVSLLVSCNLVNSPKKVTVLEQENDSLNAVVALRDSLMNEMIETFYQIESDLAFIRERGNVLSVSSENLEIETSRKDQIVNDVKDLANLLEKNKKELASLNSKLKKSGIKIKSLNNRVEKLTKTLTERSDEIASLTTELEKKSFEVSILNERVASLETESEKQNEVISQQVAQINNSNLAYYTLGTTKELEKKGVLEKRGGFLGLGKTKSVKSDFTLDYFSEFDIRTTKSISVNSDKANLISEHPAGSYEFVTENEQIAFLAINDVNEFYKFSKYIVLEVQ